MKRTLCALLVSMLFLGLLSGCGSKTSSSETNSQTVTESKTEETKTEETKTEETKTETSSVDLSGKTIEFWVGAAAGSSQDMWCRYLADKLAEYFDCTFVIQNKPGGAGFVSFNEFMGVKPDGLTCISITSSMAGSRLNPSAPQEVSVDDFTLVGSMIDDPGSLVISAEETRFTTFEELIEYAKDNEVTASITGAGSDDDLPLYYLNRKYGTKFTPIVTSGGTAQSLSDVLGGHVDIISNNAGPFVTSMNEGQTKILTVFGEERYEFAEDVPTLKELTGEEIVIGNTRGLALPKNTPEDIVNAYKEAFKWALEQEDLIQNYESIGMTVNYRDAESFYEKFGEYDKFINEYKEELGW